MNIHHHPFIKISPNDIPRAALPLTITNPFTGRKLKTYFLPNLSVPLLGVKSFLSNFVLSIDYPKQSFSIESK